VADIRQSKRRGRYLYSLCDCGNNSATKEWFQNIWWHTTTFDRDVLKPVNINDDWKPKVTEPVTEKPSEPLTKVVTESLVDLTEQDFNAEPELAVPQSGPEPKRRGFLQVAGLLLMVACGMGALWSSV